MRNDNLKREMREIEEKVEKIEKYFKKRNLSFSACIPPHDVCRNIVIAYDLGLPPKNRYDGLMRILSEYYGVAPMDNLSDEKKVPAKAIACYYANERTAYHKNKTCSLKTVLHEFFHHLHHERVISLCDDENAEKCADAYADAIIKLGNIP